MLSLLRIRTEPLSYGSSTHGSWAIENLTIGPLHSAGATSIYATTGRQAGARHPRFRRCANAEGGIVVPGWKEQSDARSQPSSFIRGRIHAAALSS